MTLGEGINAFLGANMSCGPTNIHPGKFPARASGNAIVWQAIGSPQGPVAHDDVHSSGPIAAYTWKQRVQFSCWGNSYKEAEALALELRRYIQAFRGTWGDVPIQSVFVDFEFDDDDPKRNLYRRLVDAIITYDDPSGS